MDERDEAQRDETHVEQHGDGDVNVGGTEPAEAQPAEAEQAEESAPEGDEPSE